MKTEYKRDMNHNYLILHGDNEIDTSSYQVRMLVGNVIPSLLKCRIQGMDGKFMVYYDITSRQSLSTFYEDKKLRQEEVKMIFAAFVRVMEDTAEYLMNPGQLVISPDLIFLEADKKELYFCLLPGYQKDIREQLQVLTEYILPKIDHDDEEAVRLGYGVYRKALEDSFHLEHIKEELYRVRTEDKTMISEEKQGLNVGEELWSDNEREEWKLWNGRKEEQKFMREDMESSVNSDSKGKKAGKAILGGLLFVAAAGAVIAARIQGYLPGIGTEVILGVAIVGIGAGMLLYLGVKKRKEKRVHIPDAKRERDSTEERKKNAGKKKPISNDQMQEDEISGSFSSNRMIIKNSISEQRMQIQEENDSFGHRDAEKTVILSAFTAPGPSSLVSREPGELAAIFLQEDITVVGKLENACDAVIDLPTVSRIHAKIRKRNNEYYLTDLNSRNGTSVNGRLLRPEEEYKLENEDQVDFAQARYIFVSGH